MKTKLSHKKMVFRKSTSNRNESNKSKNRLTNRFRSVNIRNHQNNNV